MKLASFLLSSAFDDLKRNKVRTFLTSLGILIGVFSVVLLIAFGLGLRNYIQTQFESLGSNLIFITPGKIISGGGFRSGPSQLGGVKFDEKDLTRLKRVAHANYVVPMYSKTVTVSVGGKSEVSDVYATTQDWFTTRNFEVAVGSFFGATDVAKRSKVVVIGPSLATKLFGSLEAAVGKNIRIENQSFSVIGVFKSKGGGGFGGPDLDNSLYMPYKTAYSFNPDKKFVALYLQADGEKYIVSVKEDAKRIMLRRYKEDDFSVIEQTEILDIVGSIFGVMNMILVAIGSISLIVGGIGIMNIMYATVTERIKEIGIRRAIGATKRDILLQFLTQAVILSLFGGILGLLFAFIAVFAIRSFFPAEINLLSVIVALGVSTLIGVFFGVFPAKRAADLSPIDAIRYE